MLQLRSAIHARRTPQRRRSIVGDTPPWFVSLPEGFSEKQLLDALSAAKMSRKEVNDFCMPQYLPVAMDRARPGCGSLRPAMEPYCAAGTKAAEDIWARRGFSEESVSKVVQRGMMYDALSRYVFLVSGETDTTTAGRALIDRWIDFPQEDAQGTALRKGLTDLLAAQWLLSAADANPELLSTSGGSGTTTPAAAAEEGPGVGTLAALTALAAAAWYFLWGPGKKGRR